jgi:hypothetical protein
VELLALSFAVQDAAQALISVVSLDIGKVDVAESYCMPGYDLIATGRAAGLSVCSAGD